MLEKFYPTRPTARNKTSITSTLKYKKNLMSTSDSELHVNSHTSKQDSVSVIFKFNIRLTGCLNQYPLKANLIRTKILLN